jgi:hypothetical protein
MMAPFAGRSKHTLKMKNKLVKEGFKIRHFDGLDNNRTRTLYGGRNLVNW